MRVADTPRLRRGVWCIEWWDEEGRRRRHSLRTTDRYEAERRLIDFRRDLHAPKDTSTVGAIVALYLAEKQDRIIDHSRLADAWKAAKSHFWHLRPDQVTAESCRAYIAKRRAAGRMDGTILKELSTVRQALNWRGVTGAVFEVPPAPPPKDRYLTRDEARKLVAAAEQEPHIELFIRIGLATAARASAILALTWDRVDFERGAIRLAVVGEQRRKGRSTVPIASSLIPHLTASRVRALGPYVVEFRGGRVGSVKKGFAAAVARAGLEDVTPHVLRHTAAVWMAEAGVSIDEIGQVLGHTDPRITYRVYARFSPNHLRKAVDALAF